MVPPLLQTRLPWKLSESLEEVGDGTGAWLWAEKKESGLGSESGCTGIGLPAGKSEVRISRGRDGPLGERAPGALMEAEGIEREYLD